VALRYKPEGRVFNCKWWHNPSGRNLASKRNGYQGYFLGCKGSRCVRLTILPPACADCHEMWRLSLLETSGFAFICSWII